MFAYTSARTGVDYLTEIDVGIWEQQLDDEAWATWVQAKRDIAAVALAHGGSISACHGSCREGEVDLVPDELGGGYDVMLDAQARARPEQHHEPRQVRARPARSRRTVEVSPVPPRGATSRRPSRSAMSDVAIMRFEHIFEVDPR